MKYIPLQWDKIKRDLNNKRIALFMDYDGTLSPIAEKPEKASMPKETRQLLCNLSKNPRCKIAIISGRALKDIKKRTGIKNITYAGNHGLEVEGPDIRFKTPVPTRHRTTLQKIKDDLNADTSTIKGILIEDKGLSLSIHYRLVSSKQIPELKTILNRITKTYTARHKIKINFGKKVFEILPPLEWNKGEVVSWLFNKWKGELKNKNIIPIYIGDDITDEDAFRVLKNKGLTIFVGKPKSSFAKYYLKNTKEVLGFLKNIMLSMTH